MLRLKQNNQRTDDKQTIRIRSLFIWLLPLLVCIMIFRFSAQNGDESTEVSHPLTQEIVTQYSKVFHLPWDEDKILMYADSIEFYVRKTGHMTEYAMLLMSMWLACKVTFVYSWKLYLYAELFTILYAASDELHQWFVPGRSAKVADVLIDTVGSLIALGLCILIHRVHDRKSPIKSKK